jgi:hypothetical protein
MFELRLHVQVQVVDPASGPGCPLVNEDRGLQRQKASLYMGGYASISTMVRR